LNEGRIVGCGLGLGGGFVGEGDDGHHPSPHSSQSPSTAVVRLHCGHLYETSTTSPEFTVTRKPADAEHEPVVGSRMFKQT
jgi:hypothetical protein